MVLAELRAVRTAKVMRTMIWSYLYVWMVRVRCRTHWRWEDCCTLYQDSSEPWCFWARLLCSMLYLRNTILAVEDRINSRTLVCVYVLHTYVLHTYSEVTVRVTAKDQINLGSMSWSDSKGSGEVLEGLGRQLVKLGGVLVSVPAHWHWLFWATNHLLVTKLSGHCPVTYCAVAPCCTSMTCL